MRATAFEFRFRLAISTIIYVLGFWAPWLRVGRSGQANLTRLWSWLAIGFAHIAGLSVQTSYIAITSLAIALAVLGAVLRLWGTAYLGRPIVSHSAMQGGAVMAAGPFRFVRNPLYLGSILTAFALSILMPAGGALFFLPALSFFAVRLVLGEEAFLTGEIGKPYIEYCKRVPRWLPGLSARLPASDQQASWPSAIIYEIFPLGIAFCFLIFAWRYDAELLIRCVLICFGVSLVTRALRVKPAS